MFEFNVYNLKEHMVSQDRSEGTLESLTGRGRDQVNYQDLSPREILDSLEAA